MTTTRKVLIVEDERDLAELVALNLERAGFDTTLAHDGREALAAAARSRPDLILLDVMLPELSGTEVAKRLRLDPSTADVPIIMLTAKAEEADEVIGLASGADDYVTKPFSLRVLLARIETVLRRADPDRDQRSTLNAGPIELRTDTHRVLVSGTEVHLTLTEFRLLATLIEGAGAVLGRKELMRRAIGPGVRVTPRTIDVHMTALRKKLGDAGRLIETVRGVGYRLDAAATADAAADAAEG
ncbi:MAG: response regulator [Phycisphaerales bacterium]|nr:response regulator [Phycisphaerales bacterium]